MSDAEIAFRDFTRNLFGRRPAKDADEPTEPTRGNVVPVEGRRAPAGPPADEMRDFTRQLFGREND